MPQTAGGDDDDDDDDDMWVKRSFGCDDVALTDSEVGQLRGQVSGDEPMPQYLVELVQSGLFLDLSDGVWRNDLVLRMKEPTVRHRQTDGRMHLHLKSLQHSA